MYLSSYKTTCTLAHLTSTFTRREECTVATMIATEVTPHVKALAGKLDVVSDDVDAVNKLKGTAAEAEWDDESQFDREKDKSAFRQYDAACDRVKAFYAVRHRVTGRG